MPRKATCLSCVTDVNVLEGRAGQRFCIDRRCMSCINRNFDQSHNPTIYSQYTARDADMSYDLPPDSVASMFGESEGTAYRTPTSNIISRASHITDGRLQPDWRRSSSTVPSFEAEADSGSSWLSTNESIQDDDSAGSRYSGRTVAYSRGSHDTARDSDHAYDYNFRKDLY